MTIQDVKLEVSKLGLTCFWDAAYQEFRVNYHFRDSRYTLDSCYYTDSKEDALGTARVMAARYRGV